MTITAERDPLQAAEAQRMAVWERLAPASRRTFGQFFTPAPLASFIADRVRLPRPASGRIKVLDPGAGVGSLGAALLKRLASELPGAPLHLTAFEMDPDVIPSLRETREAALRWAEEQGVDLEFEIEPVDFIRWAADNLVGLYRGDGLYDLAIMNPPYGKVGIRSDHRLWTAHVACEVTNLYAAFVALAIEALRDGGRLVAITPRSFTNGPYFRPFRKFLAERVVFESVDLFESRSILFADTDVLQENIVYSLARGVGRPSNVALCFHGKDGSVEEVGAAHDDLMPPDDPELFIHLRNGEGDQETAQKVNCQPSSLADLGLGVATGRVVDFRTLDNLLMAPQEGSVPLLYPQHLRGGIVTWPLAGKKPDALAVNSSTESMLFPRGHYVAVKRFTSKEERRRVSPTWIPEGQFHTAYIAFENHLNVFHERGSGLDRDLAVGLTLYLGCTMLDTFFRQFSGHTQVNATDLRSLRYPAATRLRDLGRRVSDPAVLDQETVDELVEGIIVGSP